MAFFFHTNPYPTGSGPSTVTFGHDGTDGSLKTGAGKLILSASSRFVHLSGALDFGAQPEVAYHIRARNSDLILTSSAGKIFVSGNLDVGGTVTQNGAPVAAAISGAGDFYVTNRLDAQGVLLNSSGNLVLSSSNLVTLSSSLLAAQPATFGSALTSSGRVTFTQIQPSDVYHQDGDLILSASRVGGGGTFVFVSGNLIVSETTQLRGVTSLNVGVTSSVPLTFNQSNRTDIFHDGGHLILSASTVGNPSFIFVSGNLIVSQTSELRGSTLVTALTSSDMLTFYSGPQPHADIENRLNHLILSSSTVGGSVIFISGALIVNETTQLRGITSFQTAASSSNDILFITSQPSHLRASNSHLILSSSQVGGSFVTVSGGLIVTQTSDFRGATLHQAPISSSADILFITSQPSNIRNSAGHLILSSSQVGGSFVAVSGSLIVTQGAQFGTSFTNTGVAITGALTVTDNISVGAFAGAGSNITNNIAHLTLSSSAGSQVTVSGALNITQQPRMSVTILQAVGSGTNSEVNVFSSASYLVSFNEGTDWRYNVTGSSITYNSGTGRFNINQDGVYNITSVIYLLDTASPGPVAIRVYVSGVLQWQSVAGVHQSVDPVERTVSLLKDLRVNDYVYVTVDDTSTSTLSLVSGSTINIWKVC